MPFLPRKIALVTSPTGAAVRDFLRLLRQRCPNVEVLIYPVKVQGAEAAGEIAAALNDLGAYPRRGGHRPGPGGRFPGRFVAL